MWMIEQTLMKELQIDKKKIWVTIKVMDATRHRNKVKPT